MSFKILLPLLCLLSLSASEDVQAVRVARPPKLDGRMSDPAWASAVPVHSFSQFAPAYGASATLPTEAKVLYDDHFLYVGMRMHSPGVPIKAPMFRRDGEGTGTDFANVQIDSLRSRRSGYIFSVTPSGVQWDASMYADTEVDKSWDGVWEAFTSIDAEGWTAEFRIPLALLPQRPGTQEWGINFERHVAERQELSEYLLPPREEKAWVSRFPALRGLEDLKPQLRNEWIPFLSTQRKFETAQPFDDRRWTTHAGLDAHLGLGPARQLDLAVRPDFAQVEVDQAVLNLSAIETLFPEKRPFFLEGQELFRLPGLQLFYSRRIGKALEAPTLSAGEQLLDRPLLADIAAAAKFTDQSNGLHIATLAAVTESARARLRQADGQETSQLLAPQTLHTVGRLRQSLGESGSYVGTLVTLQRAQDGSRSAGTGALDGAWTSSDRTAAMDAQASFSRISALGQADTRGEALEGGITRNWKGGLGLFARAWTIGTRFDANDLGYLDRPDQRGALLSLTQQWDPKTGPFANVLLGFDPNYSEDLRGGRAFERILKGRIELRMKNLWTFTLNGGRSLSAEDDLELRTLGQPVKLYLPRPGFAFINAEGRAPANWWWSPELKVHRAWLPNGPSDIFRLKQAFRPTPPLTLSLESTWQETQGEDAYYDTVGGFPVAGLRQLRELDLALRSTYAFSPRLTVQLFSQWLAANWRYGALRRFDAQNHTAPFTPGEIPAASQRLWNANMILRWEFQPGSTAFFVYTHGVSSDALLNPRGSLAPAPALSALRHLPSDDAVQLKVSWRLG